MNRIDFIKGIAATSAGLILPISLFPEFINNEPATKLHFVGLGGAGGNFLTHIYARNIDARYTHIDKCPRQMPCPANMTFVKYCPEQDTQIESLIQTNFSKKETIVLLAGLGGGTGTNLSAALFGRLQAAQHKVYLAATTPFLYEGEIRNKLADLIVRVMGKQKNIATFSNEEMKKRFGKLPFKDGFEQIDEIMLRKTMEMISDNNTASTGVL